MKIDSISQTNGSSISSKIKHLKNQYKPISATIGTLELKFGKSSYTLKNKSRTLEVDFTLNSKSNCDRSTLTKSQTTNAFNSNLNSKTEFLIRNKRISSSESFTSLSGIGNTFDFDDSDIHLI